MIIHAKGTANFAEKYIIHAIWENIYPPGTMLPSERELADRIGVTRTTLREVLQRLARDGWLTIQHGKPTQVNNFWETSGLNILETITELDQAGAPKLIEHLLEARKSISKIYFKKAIINNREAVIDFMAALEKQDKAENFAEMDYQIHHKLATLSTNPIYVLILNGFKNLYLRVGRYFFSHQAARDITRTYYQEYLNIAKANQHHEVEDFINRYSLALQPLWHEIRSALPIHESPTFEALG